MTPEQFINKWHPTTPAPTHADGTTSRMAMYDDLRRLTNEYMTLAERGARADAFTIAADLSRRDKDLQKVLRAKAVEALKGEPE